MTPPLQLPRHRLFALIQESPPPATHLSGRVVCRQLQVHYVARSAVFNFPDLITVQVPAKTERITAT